VNWAVRNPFARVILCYIRGLEAILIGLAPESGSGYPLPTRASRAILCMRKSPFPITAIGALQ